MNDSKVRRLKWNVKKVRGLVLHFSILEILGGNFNDFGCFRIIWSYLEVFRYFDQFWYFKGYSCYFLWGFRVVSWSLLIFWEYIGHFEGFSVMLVIWKVSKVVLELRGYILHFKYLGDILIIFEVLIVI